MPRDSNKTDYPQGFPEGFEVFASIDDPRDGGHIRLHKLKYSRQRIAGVDQGDHNALCGADPQRAEPVFKFKSFGNRMLSPDMGLGIRLISCLRGGNLRLKGGILPAVTAPRA